LDIALHFVLERADCLKKINPASRFHLLFVSLMPLFIYDNLL